MYLFKNKIKVKTVIQLRILVMAQPGGTALMYRIGINLANKFNDGP